MPYTNVGRGTLNPTQKKNSKSPDYFGSVEINGTEYELAAWKNTQKSTGKEFLGLAVSVKDEESAPAASTPEPSADESAEDGINGEIPF